MTIIKSSYKSKVLIRKDSIKHFQKGPPRIIEPVYLVFRNDFNGISFVEDSKKATVFHQVDAEKIIEEFFSDYFNNPYKNAETWTGVVSYDSMSISHITNTLTLVKEKSVNKYDNSKFLQKSK